MTDSPVSGGLIEAETDLVSLRPDLRILLAGAAATALLSFLLLPTPVAIASSVLGALMVAGADVDARTLLLPDAVTFGASIVGFAVAFFLNPYDPWTGLGYAALRALGAASALLLLRAFYQRSRGVEGLGLGDVKLAAAIGAWLPLDRIPLCFALAAAAALTAVGLRAFRGEIGNVKVPFGAFLCPALWLVFFVSAAPQ